MATKLKQVVEGIKEHSANERALVAHCLIASLETGQEEGVEEAWAELAERRYAELVSGNVEPVTWEEVKKEVKGQDAKNSISPMASGQSCRISEKSVKRADMAQCFRPLCHLNYPHSGLLY
jgi:putative addiction module component (TIGR02574 family)